MNTTRKAVIVALISGFLFGAGLLISGMTRPEKVLAFLDPLGAWDPSLALVMVGAIAVHFVGTRWKWSKGVTADPSTSIPSPRGVDAKLVAGSALFGIGWGLSGYCPGPSVVALPSASAGGAVFVIALLLGAWLAGAIERRHNSPFLDRSASAQLQELG